MTQEPDSLKGRVAIVTGGSRGIGAAVARALRERGATVAVLSRGAALEADLHLRCDVTRETDVTEAVQTVSLRLGDPTLLVCSAGIVFEKPVTDLSLDEWRQVQDASLTGTFLTCRAVLPLMRRAGGGRIVALSSGYARKGYRNGAHYAAAKAGIEGLVKSIALESAGDGITANVVAPGPIDTEMLDHVRQRPGFLDRTLELIPQRRIGTANDVVGAVLFFLGDGSRYITGQVLQVNGGMLMP